MRGAGEADYEYLFELHTEPLEGTVGCDGALHVIAGEYKSGCA